MKSRPTTPHDRAAVASMRASAEAASTVYYKTAQGQFAYDFLLSRLTAAQLARKHHIDLELARKLRRGGRLILQGNVARGRAVLFEGE